MNISEGLSPSDAKDIILKLELQIQQSQLTCIDNLPKFFHMNLALPKWNGEAEDFEFYIWRLEKRIRLELTPYLEFAAICIEILDNFP